MAMVGAQLAQRQNLHVGDQIHVTGTAQDATFTVAGIFDAGGDEDDQIFVQLNTAQALDDLDGCIDSIEVSALTTPDNELAQKAARETKWSWVSMCLSWAARMAPRVSL